LVHPKRFIKLRLAPNDDEPQRVQYAKQSEILLDEWRDVFARVLLTSTSTTIIGAAAQHEVTRRACMN
jgi:type II secretory pathway component HofQ